MRGGVRKRWALLFLFFLASSWTGLSGRTAQDLFDMCICDLLTKGGEKGVIGCKNPGRPDVRGN